MTEEKIIDELEEISQMVEGEDTVSVDEELQKIEELTNEDKGEKAAGAVKGAAEAKKASEKKKEEPKKKEKSPEKKEKITGEKKPKPTVKSPEKAVKPSNGFFYASALLIIIGLIIYGLAFYLRWNGWRIINNPPSSAVAIGGTLIILAGGELYFRGKER